MPQFADSNRASLRLVKEVAWGTMPTSGITKEVRITASSIVPSKETLISDELRSDRMVSDVTEVAAATGGDINFEMSAGSQDDFFEAFLLGAYTKPLGFYKFEGTIVEIVSATDIEITGGDFTNYFTDGEATRLSGFLSQTNNDFANVVSTSYAANVTTVVTSGPTLVAEVGNSKSKVQSAEDVFLLRDTSISSSAAGFASTGTPFAGMEASGELVIGQKINVLGLGNETATMTFTTIGLEGETFTVLDGDGNTVIFEFDDNGTVSAGNILVDVSDVPTISLLAARLAGQINTEVNSGNLNVSATSAVGVVTVKNLGPTGMVLSETTVGGAASASSGGDDSVNGIFTITSIADNLIGASPAPGTAIAGPLVSMQGSMLRNPNDASGGTRPHEVITPQSFSIETAFKDVNQFFQGDGLRLGGFSLSVAAGAQVTGTFTTQGKETKRTVSEVLTGGGYTVLDAPTNQVMNATTNVGSLELNGTALSTGIQSIELSGESTLRNQNGVGSKFPLGIGTGRFNLTGTVVAYFANADLYNAFINHTTVSLTFQLTDLDDNAYIITLPALKFTADPISPAGIDQDVMENLEFVAFRDASTQAMLQMDRFSNISTVPSQA